MAVRIKLAEADDKEAAFDVRRAVFIQEQGVPEEIELDEIDERAAHLVAYDGCRGVGAARVYAEENGGWHVGRVAVLPEWRGQGIGTALMETALRYAWDRGAVNVVIHAQVTVIPFYERLGFCCEGELFEEAGIPHRRMSAGRPSQVS